MKGIVKDRTSIERLAFYGNALGKAPNSPRNNSPVRKGQEDITQKEIIIGVLIGDSHLNGVICVTDVLTEIVFYFSFGEKRGGAVNVQCGSTCFWCEERACR